MDDNATSAETEMPAHETSPAQPATEAPPVSAPSPDVAPAATSSAVVDVAAVAAPVVEEPHPEKDAPAVVEAVADPAPTERANMLGFLHHIVNDVENFGALIESHARAAVVAGEADVHATLARLATLFGEFRVGLLNVGQTLPAKLESEAAGLVAKAKG